jgi:hypothetical protein
MEDGQIDVVPGGRMPPQQVFVMRADLANSIMMADIMIVGLGERDPKQAENQDHDSRQPRAR